MLETWPQWIIAAWLLMILLVCLHSTATEAKYRHKFAWIVFDLMLPGSLAWVLKAGGFWAVWGWP